MNYNLFELVFYLQLIFINFTFNKIHIFEIATTKGWSDGCWIYLNGIHRNSYFPMGVYDANRHDDVIKCKHFPRYWTFVRGIHRSPVNSPHKGQCRGVLIFPLICVWINGWVNNREARDLRRYRAHYDVTVVTDPDNSHTTQTNDLLHHIFMTDAMITTIVYAAIFLTIT